MGIDWSFLADPQGVRTNLIAGILVAVIVAVAGMLYRWFIHRPRSVLRRAYRAAASEAGFSKSSRKHVLAIIQMPEYFDDFVFKSAITRRQEFDKFCDLLAQRDPSLPATKTAESFYGAVFNALDKSSYHFCREIARRWNDEMKAERAAEAAKIIEAARAVVPRNAPGYFEIVLTDDRGFAEGVCAEADNYFTRLPTPLAPLADQPLVHVAAAGRDDWQLLLDAAMEEFARFKKQGREVHLVCAAPWLWCYALGVRLQDHYDLVLYHYQSHTYHRIWQVSRAIKDLKSPREGRQYQYAVCGQPVPTKQATGAQRTDAIVLAMNIGSHLDSVLSHRERHLRDVPMWTIRLKDDLSPAKPDDWVRAAADLAYAIDSLVEGRGDKHIYLYGVLPAVLGLMLGSAVGPYRHVHLMQFSGGTYKELMELCPRQ